MSLSDVETFLSAISALAVILGAGFVVLQLRQNARLLSATLRQQRSDVAVSLIERITDPTFPQRRSRMHAVMRQFTEAEWKDAFESPDDFEIRNFAYIYELVGVMGKHGLIDLEILSDVFQYLIVRDWQVFKPHVAFLKTKYSVGFNPYSNFEWLATETEHRLLGRGHDSPLSARESPRGPT